MVELNPKVLDSISSKTHTQEFPQQSPVSWHTLAFLPTTEAEAKGWGIPGRTRLE